MRANSQAMTLFMWRSVSPRHPRRKPHESVRDKRWKMSDSAIPRRSACRSSESKAHCPPHVRTLWRVGVRPERVVVTAGLSAGFVLAFLALLDQGYSLGLPSPGYPCYCQILKALNVRP